jgi:sn-glycerol 3-phosphate transport system permease protein|tara:strand:- start:4870 stop:5718 length:849 start_codon:yes stop_codon:yes gene_type:complete
MVENRKFGTFVAHSVLILGLLIVALPIWIAFVASTHSIDALLGGNLPLWPGDKLIENYSLIMSEEVRSAGGSPVLVMMKNSLIMALSIAIGKIVISILAAYAIVYFDFPFRMVFFWMIFLTLMLPVEVRILPTFQIAANLNLLNSYAGLSLPLIASATATFLFRQFFLTIPDELAEAAQIDGAGPVKFFWDVVLPLSRTNIAALFVILFIYGWNQYLWPLLITTDEKFYTLVMGIQRMVTVSESIPVWHLVMASAILAMLPPVLVVVFMQKLFVKGLVETEK